MQILYVDQTGQLGGGELSLFDWLLARPENARVVLFEDGPFRRRLESIGIPVHVVSLLKLKKVRRESNLLQVFAQLPAFLELHRRFAAASADADILYANSQKAFFIAALAKRKDQALVWHLRDILSKEHFSPFLRFAAGKFGSAFATVILVNSQASAEAFIEAGGRPEKVRITPDGVNPSPFDEVTPESVSILRKGLKAEGKFCVGLFGRLSSWKGQHVLLEAIASTPGVHAFLVGASLFGETAYAEELQSRASREDLAGRVHFLGFRDDIPRLMKAMDAVVHTSIAAEPLGRVIIEGMCAGKPVIATRAGGAAEIVEHDKSGLLVAPGSAEELADAIARLRGDPLLRERLAVGGRKRALSDFSLDIMVERIDTVLNQLPASQRAFCSS